MNIEETIKAYMKKKSLDKNDLNHIKKLVTLVNKVSKPTKTLDNQKDQVD